jgi:hypothetical protein
METNIEQTGLIYKDPRPTDWTMGGETGITLPIRLDSGDWSTFLPLTEKQSSYTFDTVSCVTFSALNCIESQIKWMISQNLIPDDVWQILKDLGYVQNGELNFSDRFTAIMSGTTRQGNDVNSVWDSIRKDGLLPEADLPFGGNSFETYHNKALITPAMKAKAKMILALFSFNYDYVFFSNGAITTDKSLKAIEALKTCPVHAGIPYPSTHAVMFYKWSPDGNRDYFDTYVPFQRHQLPTDGINFGVRGVVTLKQRTFPIVRFNTDMTLGANNTDVANLQTVLKTLGFLNVAPTGYFGPITKQAVISFQQAWGITATGYVGPITRAKLNEIISYDNPKGNAQTELAEIIINSIISLIKKIIYGK